MDYSKIKNIIFENDKGKIRVRYRTLNNKLHRLPPSEHPRFESMEEAYEWRQKKEAYLQSEKARIIKIQNQNSKYPEVTCKVELFIEFKKNQKVKEFKTIHSYFNNYILNFYLNKLAVTNINSWSLNHDDFFKYLRNGSQTKFKRPLSNETIRKIGFYLNEFYLFLYRKHLVDQPIPPFIVPEPEDNLKSLERESEKLAAIEDYFEVKNEYLNLADLKESEKFDLVPPMKTIYINGGKRDKIRKGDILGALINEAKITANDIGNISVLDKQSYVAIKKEFVGTVIDSFVDGKIKGRKYKVGLA